MSTKWINLSKDDRKILTDTLPEGRLKNKILKLDKRIKISSAKGKGRALQYWVGNKIAELFGIVFNQHDDQCLIHSREMGQAGSDIILRGKVYEAFPYSIECKSVENLSLAPTIEQVKKNTPDDKDWLIVHKRKAIPKPVVIMEWDAFEKLFKRGWYD